MTMSKARLFLRNSFGWRFLFKSNPPFDDVLKSLLWVNPHLAGEFQTTDNPTIAQITDDVSVALSTIGALFLTPRRTTIVVVVLVHHELRCRPSANGALVSLLLQLRVELFKSDFVDAPEPSIFSFFSSRHVSLRKTHIVPGNNPCHIRCSSNERHEHKTDEAVGQSHLLQKSGA